MHGPQQSHTISQVPLVYVHRLPPWSKPTQYTTNIGTVVTLFVEVDVVQITYPSSTRRGIELIDAFNL